MDVRQGPRPTTQRHLPHSQLDQQPADPSIREELARRCFSLPGVVERPTGISVPGARALVLEVPAGPEAAFMVGGEFAHLHPAPDLSLHVTLPTDVAEDAIEAGWAEWHPLVDAGELPRTVVLLYAPRDEAELDAVWQLVEASHRYASTAAATGCGC